MNQNTSDLPLVDDKETVSPATSNSASSESTDSTPCSSPAYGLVLPDSLEELLEPLSDMNSTTPDRLKQLDILCNMLCDTRAKYALINDGDGTEAMQKAREYLHEVYDFIAKVFGDLLLDLLAKAQSNESFRQFVAITNQITDPQIYLEASEIINSFEYGRQLGLLKTKQKFDGLLDKLSTGELVTHQNAAYEIYQTTPNNINQAAYLLIRCQLLQKYLQQHLSLSNPYSQQLLKDLIFIAEGLRSIFLATESNKQLQAMISLPVLWDNFTVLLLNFIAQYNFTKLNLYTVKDLHAQNINLVLDHLTARYRMQQILDPKYFLTFRQAAKPIPIFLEDNLGRIMRENYHKRPSSSRIILAAIDCATIVSMLDQFETILTQSFPSEVLEEFLSKAILLHKSYIEQSFSKQSDIDRLLAYYYKYAIQADQIYGTTNALAAYFFKISESVAHRYYYITGRNIPGLDEIEQSAKQAHSQPYNFLS